MLMTIFVSFILYLYRFVKTVLIPFDFRRKNKHFFNDCRNLHSRITWWKNLHELTKVLVCPNVFHRKCSWKMGVTYFLSLIALHLLYRKETRYGKLAIQNLQLLQNHVCKQFCFLHIVCLYVYENQDCSFQFQS